MAKKNLIEKCQGCEHFGTKKGKEYCTECEGNDQFLPKAKEAD